MVVLLFTFVIGGEEKAKFMKFHEIYEFPLLIVI